MNKLNDGGYQYNKYSQNDPLMLSAETDMSTLIKRGHP